MGTYMHRVGRTARAGRQGQAITVVTQYDIQVFQELEAFLKKRLVSYGGYKHGYDEKEVELLATRVAPALREGKVQIQEAELRRGSGKKKRKAAFDPLEDSEATGILDTFQRGSQGKKSRKGKRR